MAFRWVSTPESIKANQPSALAIAETLGAMAVSVWIAVTWDTYLHIAIAASIAPFLLMRTDESCIRGSDMAYKLVSPPHDVLERISEAAGFRLVILRMARLLWNGVWFPIALALARIATWVATLVQHPLVALAAIPGNWEHATVVLDSKKWPDILPTPREGRGAEAFFDVGFLLEETTVLWWVVFSPVILSAFVYRWSLKSTAIIWFPLLWAMRAIRKAGKSFPDYLSAYVRSPTNVIVLCVSIAAIIAFLTKLILWNEWAGFVDWWNGSPLRHFLSLYVTPAEIQWWQVAVFANSIIAIAMYLLAVQWLVLKKYRQITTETLPQGVFRIGLFIRPILSCYTIACTLYITVLAAFDWNWPELGTKLFPWG